MKSLLTSSLAIALAAGLASCGKQSTTTEEASLPEALPTETEAIQEQPVEPEPAPPEPAPSFSMTVEELTALVQQNPSATVFEKLGEPIEKVENIDKYRHNLYRYQGEITGSASGPLTILELVVSPSKSRNIVWFGFPETYDAARKDTMMDEDAFRAAVDKKSPEEISAALGAPTFISQQTESFGKPYHGISYRMWIRRDNQAYPGATINYTDGKYTGYSFHMDEVKELGE